MYVKFLYIYLNIQKFVNIYAYSYNLRTRRIGWTAGWLPRRADLRVLIGRLPLCSPGLLPGAPALGGLVFALLCAGHRALAAATSTAPLFFAATAAAGLGGLPADLPGVLRVERTPSLADARLCCGTASAVGALLAALIRMLACASGTGLCAGAALCCAFLALMAEGILCFLRRYITAPPLFAAVRSAVSKAPARLRTPGRFC